MDKKHPPFLIVFYSLFLITTVVSAHTHPLSSTQHHHLTKRQAPPSLENSILNPLSPNVTGANRATSPSPTPSPSDPASNSSTTPSTAPSVANPNANSPLIPLLGSTIPIPPPASSTNPSTNSSSTTPPPAPATTNSTSPPATNSSVLPTTTTPPAGKSSNSTTPVAGSAPPVSTQPSEPTSSTHSTSSNPATNNRSESHASAEKSSTFGSTTIKILGIAGGVVAGLFLLWTIIRKWKFRPSKRFANKLEDYDDHMFEPRPPSFSEKRPNEFSSYGGAKQIPVTRSISPGGYLPERAHTPHNTSIPRQNLFSENPSPLYPAHRLSNISLTKPLPIFDSNYRLSLALASDISHSYPPSDYPQPKVS